MAGVGAWRAPPPVRSPGGSPAEAGFDPSHLSRQQNQEEGFGQSRPTFHQPTSGLSWKIPGRVGDSPILGAGLYLDDEVGSAGSTGVGEANLLNLSSYLVVEGMKRGLSVENAVMDACKRVATTSVRDPKRRRPDGKTTFNVSFYPVNQKGVADAILRFVGARQLVRGHRPAGVAPSGPRGGHVPVLAHQLASARKDW